LGQEVYRTQDPLCQFLKCSEHSGKSQKRDSMLEYHQPECNILPDHISNRMPCRNLRLYQAQTIADLRVRSGMRDLESESLVGVSVVDLFILRHPERILGASGATYQTVTR
jgi:hypothetical protein